MADSAAIPLIGRATELDRVRAAIERASSAAGSTLSEVELCRGTYDPDRQRRCSPARRVPGGLADIGFKRPEIHELLGDFPLKLIIARKHGGRSLGAASR